MNPVLCWNAIRLEASRRDFTHGFNIARQPGPIRTSRATAILFPVNATCISADHDGSTRTRVEKRYDSVAEAVRENSVGRIGLGVHRRFDGLPRSAADTIGGTPPGLAVGEEAHALFNTGASLAGAA